MSNEQKPKRESVIGPVETRYNALRLIAKVILLFGYVVGVLGVIGACSSVTLLMQEDAVTAIAAGVGSLLSTAIFTISLIASSNSIRLFIDVEENTRRTEALMEEMVKMQRYIVRSMQ